MIAAGFINQIEFVLTFYSLIIFKMLLSASCKKYNPFERLLISMENGNWLIRICFTTFPSKLLRVAAEFKKSELPAWRVILFLPEPAINSQCLFR